MYTRLYLALLNLIGYRNQKTRTIESTEGRKEKRGKGRVREGKGEREIHTFNKIYMMCMRKSNI